MALRRTPLALLLAGGLVIAACGGDDDTTATVETPAGDLELDEAIDAVGDLSIETRIDAIASVLGDKVTDVEVVDDKTARIRIDGPAAGDSTCMIAYASVLNPDDVLIVEYDDEEVTCEPL